MGRQNGNSARFFNALKLSVMFFKGKDAAPRLARFNIFNFPLHFGVLKYRLQVVGGEKVLIAILTRILGI